MLPDRAKRGQIFEALAPRFGTIVPARFGEGSVITFTLANPRSPSRLAVIRLPYTSSRSNTTPRRHSTPSPPPWQQNPKAPACTDGLLTAPDGSADGLF